MVGVRQAKRALVVMAHPDDIDFWGVGTVIGWIRQGWQVSYALVSDGGAGGVPGVGQQRRQEQLTAAELAGVEAVSFFDGYLDGQIAATPALVKDVSRVIRQLQPARVLTQSPVRNWSDIRLTHPDHLAVGEAVVQAVYPAARNPYAFPELLADEGLEPWVVTELWLQGDPTPNRVVDVTNTFPEREAAVLAHASQHPDLGQARRRLRQDLATCAAKAGLPDGHYAEAFNVVQITY